MPILIFIFIFLPINIPIPSENTSNTLTGQIIDNILSFFHQNKIFLWKRNKSFGKSIIFLILLFNIVLKLFSFPRFRSSILLMLIIFWQIYSPKENFWKKFYQNPSFASKRSKSVCYFFIYKKIILLLQAKVTKIFWNRRFQRDKTGGYWKLEISKSKKHSLHKNIGNIFVTFVFFAYFFKVGRKKTM